MLCTPQLPTSPATQAVTRLHCSLVGCLAAGSGVIQRALGLYASLAQQFLASPAFERHRDAILASPSTQQALVAVLLDRCLPCADRVLQAQADSTSSHGSRGHADSCAASSGSGSGSGSSGGSAGAAGHADSPMSQDPLFAYHLLCNVAVALTTPGLGPVISTRVCQPGSVALIQTACRVATALPLAPPEGVPPQDFCDAHFGAICTLGNLAQFANPDEHQAGSSATNTSGGGSGGGGGSAAPGGGGLPSLGSLEGRSLVAWELLAALPRLMDVLRLLIIQQPEQTGVASVMCSSLTAVLQLIMRSMTGAAISKLDQLTAWAAAADAGLRLLPLLAQLDADMRSGGEYAGGRTPAAQLWSICFTFWAAGTDPMYGCARDWAAHIAATAAVPAATRTTTAARLCQLHATVCRLMHWLAASSERLQLLHSLVGAGLRLILPTCLHCQLLCTLALMQHAEPGCQLSHTRWARCLQLA